MVDPTLRLDALRPADAEALFAVRSHPEVARWQGWVPDSVEAALAFIEGNATAAFGTPGGWRQLAIRVDGELVGDLGANVDGEARQAEIGITIAPWHQRRGLATGALGLLLDRLLAPGSGVDRVVASVDPRNTASMALMVRAGLRQEALHRKSLWWRGEWVDDAVFSIERAARGAR